MLASSIIGVSRTPSKIGSKCGKNYITFQNNRGFEPRLWVVTCPFASAYRYLRKRPLRTNHEEADTKICYRLHHAVRRNNNGETVCIVRSSSSDIDIPVILLAKEMPYLFLYVGNGAGKNKKVLDLSPCSLSKDKNLKKLFLAYLHSLEMIMCHHFYRKGNRYTEN